MTCTHREIITTGSELGEEFGTCQLCGQVRRYYWQDGANYDLKRKVEITKEGVEPMDIKRIRERYENGDEIPAIIEEEEVPRKRLYEILHEYGVELRKPPENKRAPNEIKDEIDFDLLPAECSDFIPKPSPKHPAIEALLGFLPPAGTPMSRDQKTDLNMYFLYSIDLMYPTKA